jgi:hypothetical protein
MPKPIYITAPRPTVEELDKRWRISKARKKELQVLVDQFKTQIANRNVVPVNSLKPEKRRKRASAA